MLDWRPPKPHNPSPSMPHSGSIALAAASPSPRLDAANATARASQSEFRQLISAHVWHKTPSRGPRAETSEEATMTLEECTIPTSFCEAPGHQPLPPSATQSRIVKYASPNSSASVRPGAYLQVPP